jgi:hypothetical protein
MTVNDTNTVNKRVLTYLKKVKIQNQSNSNIIAYFAANINDIIKFIERPDDCGTWPFDFVCQVNDAIKKINKLALIDFPKIEKQTEEDRVLSRLLRKNNFFAFGTNLFFGSEITVFHVIAYMERDEVIYDWNADFVIGTKQEVKRVKEFLL